MTVDCYGSDLLVLSQLTPVAFFVCTIVCCDGTTVQGVISGVHDAILSGHLKSKCAWAEYSNVLTLTGLK